VPRIQVDNSAVNLPPALESALTGFCQKVQGTPNKTLLASHGKWTRNFQKGPGALPPFNDLFAQLIRQKDPIPLIMSHLNGAHMSGAYAGAAIKWELDTSDIHPVDMLVVVVHEEGHHIDWLLGEALIPGSGLEFSSIPDDQGGCKTSFDELISSYDPRDSFADMTAIEGETGDLRLLADDFTNDGVINCDVGLSDFLVDLVWLQWPSTSSGIGHFVSGWGLKHNIDKRREEIFAQLLCIYRLRPISNSWQRLLDSKALGSFARRFEARIQVALATAQRDEEPMFP